MNHRVTTRPLSALVGVQAGLLVYTGRCVCGHRPRPPSRTTRAGRGLVTFYNQVPQNVLIEPESLREVFQLRRLRLEAEAETVAVIVFGERVAQTLLRGKRALSDLPSDL